MMGLSDGRKSVRIGLAVLIQYRSVTDTQPPSHVAVAITLNALAKASSLKIADDDQRSGVGRQSFHWVGKVGEMTVVGTVVVLDTVSQPTDFGFKRSRVRVRVRVRVREFAPICMSRYFLVRY